MRSLFEEGEPRYEDRALLSYVAHTHDCARSRRNTNKATDRQREADRSNEAEGARWLQARWNGQGNEALGGRMYGGAGAKNRYAIRRVRSVGPRCGGRDHAEGSAVTLQFMCNRHSITTNQQAIRALFRVINRYVGDLAPMPGVFPVGSRLLGRQLAQAIRPNFNWKEKPLGRRSSGPFGTGAGPNGRKTLVSERGVPNTAATLASRQAHDTAL